MAIARVGLVLWALLSTTHVRASPLRRVQDRPHAGNLDASFEDVKRRFNALDKEFSSLQRDYADQMRAARARAQGSSTAYARPELELPDAGAP
jgi:hypothetical protein